MTHLCIPVLEITETGPLCLSIVCAELQCIVNNFTMKSIDRKNSVFICHLLTILQVPGQHILHLTCAYFERLFAMMQKPELHSNLKSVTCQQFYNTLDLGLPKKHKKECYAVVRFPKRERLEACQNTFFKGLHVLAGPVVLSCSMLQGA